MLQDLTILSNIIGHLELKNHSLNVLNESGPFTIVIDSRGNEFVVRKLSICWLLNKESSKLSSDHFQRVRQSEYEKKEKLKNYSKNPHCNSIVVSKEINISEWCLFKQTKGKDFLIGLVVRFLYLKKVTWKNKKYTNTFAKITGNTKSVGVLCNWFNIDNNGNLILVKTVVHKYVPINNYILTLPALTWTSFGFVFNKDICEDASKKVRNVMLQ